MREEYEIMYVISSCLLGNNCKYDGGNNKNEKVLEFYRTNSCCTVCPELLGGLSSPRPPAEISQGKVIDINGRDNTEAFAVGAQKSWLHVLKQAERRREKIEGAILKSNSPSCGSGFIYDGSFTGKLIEGDGMFAEILKKHGIEVKTEKDL